MAHAEENEEEFVYVIEGEVDAWIDGNLHRMVAGDLAAFPAGTGICHCFINNTERGNAALGRRRGCKDWQSHPLSTQSITARRHESERLVGGCASAATRAA